MNTSPKAHVFNIQPFSIHDGPGIRTTLFLKGCPLRCVWCQNSESQLERPELFFDVDKCAGCGKCVEVCPNNAISLKDGHSSTERAVCDASGECVAVCPNGAREIMGRIEDMDTIFDRVMADEIFYRQSGGGITVSGGEPLSQPEFVTAFLRRCKEAGMHTTLDTSGHARWKHVQQVLEYVDLVLYDFKHMDPVQHEKLTSVSNKLILKNARRIYHELGVSIQARTPVVSGFNDSVENIGATASYIAEELSPAVEYHLLPYHKFGEKKQEQLEWGSDRAFTSQAPSDQHMAELKRTAESFGLKVLIGG
jgi:pyruvate formate lyase activating enzyme